MSRRTEEREAQAISGLGWWWRLQILRWKWAENESPIRRMGARALWLALCVIGPAVASLDEVRASNAIELILSLDIPLTLLLAILVLINGLRAASQRGAEDWLWRRESRPAGVRWVSRLRWMSTMRWPSGLVIATFILSLSAKSARGHLAELLMMVLLAVVLGLLVVWVMPQMRSAERTRPARSVRRARGLAALSWVAFHETRERLDPRRMMMVSLPIFLSAPMGAMASQVAGVLAVYLPVAFVVAMCRECFRTQAALRSWLPSMSLSAAQVSYWVWRWVALGIAILFAATAWCYAPHGSLRAALHE